MGGGFELLGVMLVPDEMIDVRRHDATPRVGSEVAPGKQAVDDRLDRLTVREVEPEQPRRREHRAGIVDTTAGDVGQIHGRASYGGPRNCGADSSPLGSMPRCPTRPATPADADDGRATGHRPGRSWPNRHRRPVRPSRRLRSRRSLARSMSALLGAQVVTWVMSTAVAIVVPRLLGPESSGHLQLAIVDLGRRADDDLARHEHPRDARDRPRPARSSFELGPALVARLVAYAVAWVPLGSFVLIADYGSEVKALFVIVGVTTLASSIAELARSSHIGFEHFGIDRSRRHRLPRWRWRCWSIAAAVITEDVRVVAIGRYHPGPAVRDPAVPRAAPGRADQRTDGRCAAAWTAVRQSAPYLWIGVAFILYMQIDVVLMSFFVSDVEIGWYGQADSLFATLLFVPTIMMTSLFPRQAREHAENPESTQRHARAGVSDPDAARRADRARGRARRSRGRRPALRRRILGDGSGAGGLRGRPDDHVRDDPARSACDLDRPTRTSGSS